MGQQRMPSKKVLRGGGSFSNGPVYAAPKLKSHGVERSGKRGGKGSVRQPVSGSTQGDVT